MQATVSKPLPSRVSNRKKAAFGVAVLCIGLSAAAVLPFFFMGRATADRAWRRLSMPATHDMSLHLYQMRSFDAGLRAGEVYPKWEIDTNRGFGAPTTSFYPPGIYYLTSLFHLFFSNWLLVVLVLELLAMIASGAAMYAYARRYMPPPPAALAMCMYLILPYHLIDQYHRGAIAELLSFIWMPLLFLFVDLLFDSGGSANGKQRTAGERSAEPLVIDLSLEPVATEVRPAKPSSHFAVPSFVGLALTYAAFLWSHPPTAYQVSLILAIVIPWLAIMKRNWKGLLLTGSGLAVGLGLAAAYVYPAVREKQLTTLDIISQLWPYQESYVFVHNKPFFFSLINQTWVLNLAIIILCALAIIWIRSHPTLFLAPRRGVVALWIGIGVFASYMMTSASHWINRVVPMVETGIYSWRMLSISTLAAALLTGAIANYAFNTARDAPGRVSLKPRVVAYLTCLIIVGSVAFSLIMVVGGASPNPFEQEPEHLNVVMLPKTAIQDLSYLPNGLPEAALKNPSGAISLGIWDPQHREIRVNLPEPNRISIRVFNYPGWTSAVDGHPCQIQTGPRFGNIEMDLAAGSHLIVLDYLDTPVRRTGWLINICVAFAMVGFFGMWIGWRITRYRIRCFTLSDP